MFSFFSGTCRSLTGDLIVPFKADRDLVVVIVPMCYAPVLRRVGDMGVFDGCFEMNSIAMFPFRVQWKLSERYTPPLETFDLYESCRAVSRMPKVNPSDTG
jgi:hypothetical protein